MQNTEDLQPGSGNSNYTAAANLILDHALKLHGTRGSKQAPFFLHSTRRLLAGYGTEWIRQNRVRLIVDLEYLAIL